MSNHHDQSRCVSSGWICANHVPPPIPSTMNPCCSLCPIIGCLRWLRRNLKACMGESKFAKAILKLAAAISVFESTHICQHVTHHLRSLFEQITCTTTNHQHWFVHFPLGMVEHLGRTGLFFQSTHSFLQLSSGITFLPQKLTIAICVTKATTVTVHPV